MKILLPKPNWKGLQNQTS